MRCDKEVPAGMLMVVFPTAQLLESGRNMTVTTLSPVRCNRGGNSLQVDQSGIYLTKNNECLCGAPQI